MKIFLSWAGEGSASHQVAQIFHGWLPNVIQSLRPWISSRDIQKGSRPAIELTRELHDHSFGIICVTKKSVDSKWLNFEAGALSKQLDESRVYPFLFRMRPSEVTGPLAGFQQAIYNPDRDVKEEVYRLMWAINTGNGIPLISADQLKDAFEMWWPKLLVQLNEIAEKQEETNDGGSKQSTASDPAIEEILRIVRGQQRISRSNPFVGEDILVSGNLAALENRFNSRDIAQRERIKTIIGLTPSGILEDLLTLMLPWQRGFIELRFGLAGNQPKDRGEAVSLLGLSPNHPGIVETTAFGEFETLYNKHYGDNRQQ